MLTGISDVCDIILSWWGYYFPLIRSVHGVRSSAGYSERRVSSIQERRKTGRDRTSQ